MQKNFHIGKFFGRARRRSLRLAITTRTIGVERSFLLWAPVFDHALSNGVLNVDSLPWSENFLSRLFHGYLIFTKLYFMYARAVRSFTIHLILVLSIDNAWF